MKMHWVAMLSVLALWTAMARAEADPEVLKAEAARVAVMDKAKDSVLAVFSSTGGGGGSGVVISPDGFALTNYHVVKPCGNAMKCGMADGKSYDAVLVGIDPTGDVALIKLVGRKDFPVAPLGDSDELRAGDYCFAMGNPFLLATDFRPTTTFGIVSGTHRYQYPAGTLLEYADCIQTDASINPGNSGGPLFNAAGELIGINGRGSFEKRGRVNVGVAYAISINQIKNFLGHLHSGRIVDHATLGATVVFDDEGHVIVDNILEESDAYRRGLRSGDEVIAFGGRPIATPNAFKNVLGIFPKGWRVPLSFRHEGQRFDVLVRLRGVHGKEELIEKTGDGAKPIDIDKPKGKPGKKDDKPAPKPKPNDGKAGNFAGGVVGGLPTEPRRPTEGLASRFEHDLASIAAPRPWLDEDDEPAPEPKDETPDKKDSDKKPGDKGDKKPDKPKPIDLRRLIGPRTPPMPAELKKFFEAKRGYANYHFNKLERERVWKAWTAKCDLAASGAWTLVGELGGGGKYRYELGDEKVLLKLPNAESNWQAGDDLARSLEPRHSGGLHLAMFLVRRLAVLGPEKYGEVYYDGTRPLAGRKELCDVLVAAHRGTELHVYFDPASGDLLAAEMFPEEDVDPCELYFTEHREFDGKRLPGRIDVRYGDEPFATFKISDCRIEKAAAKPKE